MQYWFLVVGAAAVSAGCSVETFDEPTEDALGIAEHTSNKAADCVGYLSGHLTYHFPEGMTEGLGSEGVIHGHVRLWRNDVLAPVRMQYEASESDGWSGVVRGYYHSETGRWNRVTGSYGPLGDDNARGLMVIDLSSARDSKRALQAEIDFSYEDVLARQRITGGVSCD